MLYIIIGILFISAFIVLLGFDKLMDFIAGIFMVATSVLLFAGLLVIMFLLGIVGIPMTIIYAIYVLGALLYRGAKEIVKHYREM